MKILVTGAGGYIGRYAVKALLDFGANVIACDLFTDDIDKRAQITSADIFSGDKDIFEQTGRPDVCLHMAWRDGFNHNAQVHMLSLSSHYEFISNMVNGGLSHLAVMGSMHEVGYHEGAIDENTACNPVSMYGIAKNALRQSLFFLTKDTDVVIQWLRAYYILGDDSRNQSIFSKIMQAESLGKKNFPFTSGKNKYDFIDVADLAEQIAACVMQQKINGIINCCTGNPISLAEKVEEFIKLKNLSIRLDYGAFPDRPYDSPGVWGDNYKINSIMADRDASTKG